MFDGEQLYTIMFATMEESHPGEAIPYDELGEDEQIVLDKTAIGILRFFQKRELEGTLAETDEIVFTLDDDEDDLI